MSSSQVIANYQLLATLAAQMLEAAAKGDWDQLIGLEHQCSELVATMKSLDAATILDAEAHQRKRQLIARILADDAEIRKHAEAWMAQLQLNIQSNRQEQRLLHAYGA